MADDNGSGATGNPDWINSVPAEYKPLVEAKGWKSPTDPLVGYANLEKLVGTKRLEAPQETWDDAKWGEFYRNIGAPETPDAYEFPEAAKIEDEDFAKWSKDTAKELGLTPRQFAKLTERYTGYVGSRAEAMGKAESDAIAEGDAALRKDWGGGYEQKVTVAKAAVKAMQDKLGLSEGFVDRVEKSLGYAATIRLFATLGEDYGIGREGRAPGQGQGGITPDQASAELQGKMADENFMKALTDRSHPGHADAVSVFGRLVDMGGKTPGQAGPRY